MLKHLTFCAIAAISLSACSERESALDLPPGQYNHVSKSTDANGTDHAVKETTSVGYDAYGNKTAVVNKKNTTDPRGLFNKSTNQSTTVVKE